MSTVRSRFDAADPAATRLFEPRDDLVREARDGDGAYAATAGPFESYRRTVRAVPHGYEQEVTFRLAVPWFGWLFTGLSRLTFRRLPHHDGRQPWWGPPDRLDPRQANALGLLGAAYLVVGFLNTLFTQTVAFAADEFGATERAQGVAGTVVRCGIVFAIVLVFLADRKGRRAMLLVALWAAPAVGALGAVAPSFAILTATQTIARPLAIALGLLVGIVVAEEMPRNSRAYGISIIAMAGGLGAGLCVMALPLADVGTRGWRLVYLVPILALPVAISLTRRLPESHRFEQPHAPAPQWHRNRFILLATSGLLVNLLVAPASFFRNRYLKDVRGYSAARISAFVLVTNTPGAVGIVAGGRLADVHGRRKVGAFALLASTVGGVAMFAWSGASMWLASAVASIVGAAAVPALGVYGAELFPTGQRGRANGLITALGLIGSSLGLLAVGALVDRGRSYGAAMALMALGPIIVVGLVLLLYPETAHRELDDINPEDRVVDS